MNSAAGCENGIDSGQQKSMVLYAWFLNMREVKQVIVMCAKQNSIEV